MKKSSGEIIAEQASKIAELERGLGDIFLFIKELKIGKEHVFIKNENYMIEWICKEIKTLANAESGIRSEADNGGQGTEVEN